MSNIVKFPYHPRAAITDKPIPVKDVLLAADRANLKETVVIGFREDGEEFYFASSEADGGTVLWLLEMAKKRLLEASEEIIG